jgi:hypothetical protein
MDSVSIFPMPQNIIRYDARTINVRHQDNFVPAVAGIVWLSGTDLATQK